MSDTQDEDEVTLPSGLVLDLVDECRHLGAVARPLIKMTASIDASRPQARCPLELFNDVADWIERELGMTSVRMAGRQIGHRYFAAMQTLGLPEKPTTMAMMRELESASRTIVYDPEGHGWDLIRHDATSAVMRNSQDTNCILGEGLLLSLMDRTGVSGVYVRQSQCARHGAECCEYEITWKA